MIQANDKAKQLVDKFRKHSAISVDKTIRTKTENAKACALICVDEILSAHFMKRDSGHKTFWINVREEIKNINL